MQAKTYDQAKWKRPFFTIWTGQAISLVGSRVARFVLIWWLTITTGSATVLALATLAAMVPQVVLGPIAGVFVDRWNRRKVMMVADSVIALASLWLAYLFFVDALQVWHVYIVILISALGGMFHWPAMQASTSLMIPKEHLARVSGINQALNGGMNIIGPALGALLLELLPFHSIMLLDVALAAFAITPLFFIFIPQPEKIANGGEDGEEQPSVWADLRAGLDYLLGWRGLMVLTVGAMIFKIAMTPAFALIPLLVTDHFGGDAPELAALEAAVGIGIIIGGILLGVWGGFKRRIYTIGLALVLAGLLITLMGVLPPTAFLLAVISIFFLGIFIAMIDGPMFAVLQGTIAPEMQGRVFMLFGSLVSITSPIGLLIAGPVTDAVGVQFWFVIAGLLATGVAVTMLFIPAVRNLEQFGQQADSAPEASPSLAGVEAEVMAR